MIQLTDLGPERHKEISRLSARMSVNGISRVGKCCLEIHNRGHKGAQRSSPVEQDMLTKNQIKFHCYNIASTQHSSWCKQKHHLQVLSVRSVLHQENFVRLKANTLSKMPSIHTGINTNMYRNQTEMRVCNLWEATSECRTHDVPCVARCDKDAL
jgi:hypothetical protein